MLSPVTRLVSRLRDFRTFGHPLVLIAVWATLHAGTIAWIELLPGSPFYSDSDVGSLGSAIFWAVVLVVFVALGSRLAWWLAIFSSTVGVGMGVAAGVFELGVKPF